MEDVPTASIFTIINTTGVVLERDDFVAIHLPDFGAGTQPVLTKLACGEPVTSLAMRVLERSDVGKPLRVTTRAMGG